MLTLELTEDMPWSKANAARISPDGKLMLRIDDHWYMAEEL